MTDQVAALIANNAHNGALVSIKPSTGEILANRYQIETRIGEGAMGAVYKARHVKVGRGKVKISYPGKHGIKRTVTVTDRRLVRIALHQMSAQSDSVAAS